VVIITVELKNISKTYTSKVLRDLSYTFKSGNIYVIKGVSGCGKTTLLNILGGVETEFDGEIITEMPNDISSVTSYIFQNSLLLSNITVLENLLLIKNNLEEIKKCAEQLNISDLLMKKPEHLSGGERQRVAIVRALLIMPKLFLADEPTASLDSLNSKSVAEIIAKLRSDKMIIIISTHESYFDELADEVIYINYGSIDRTEKITPRIIKSISSEKFDKKSKRPRLEFNPIGFNLKRNPKLLSFGSLCPLILVFFIVMIISTLQKNFNNEYFRSIKSEYPMDMFAIHQFELDRFPYKDGVKIYDNYIASFEGINAYYLPTEKNSVFKIKKMISHGEFPQTDYGLLASRDFIIYTFSDDNYENYIGEKIIYGGIEFKISGILADLNHEEIKYNLLADAFYQRIPTDNIIFIPYETLQRIGEIQNNDMKIGVYNGLSNNPVVLEHLIVALESGCPNQFYKDIEDSQEILNGVAIVFLIVLFISYIISCIFMISIIQTELFYRRKEIGFLQIFGLSKKRILEIIFAGYFIKISVSVAVASILYVVAIFIYFIIFNSFVVFDFIGTLAVIILLFSVYLSAAFFSCKGFLRRSVKSLIT
jgi:ABC-type lipoprotein export system ATPase subunit